MLNCLGLIFAQFPDACTPVSTPEPDKSLESASEPDESEEGHVSPKPVAARGHPLARPYAELGDGQVTEILSKHLELFQTASKLNKMKDCHDIVLHREAMEHCARLYRAVVRISCCCCCCC